MQVNLCSGKKIASTFMCIIMSILLKGQPIKNDKTQFVIYQGLATFVVSAFFVCKNIYTTEPLIHNAHYMLYSAATVTNMAIGKNSNDYSIIGLQNAINLFYCIFVINEIGNNFNSPSVQKISCFYNMACLVVPMCFSGYIITKKLKSGF